MGNPTKPHINPAIALIAQRISDVTSACNRELHAGQKKVVSEVFEKGKKRIIIMAGRSWGKSLVCHYILSRLLCFPGKSGFMIGPTRKQQKEITWEPFDGIKSFFPNRLNVTFSETEQRLECPWGSFGKIDGSENHQSFRGVPYDLMIMDEGQMCDWRFYDSAYPNLSKRNGVLIVIGTMDLDLNNPFMRLWKEAQEDEDWCCIKAPSWENPHIRAWLEKEKKKYIARGESAEWEREFECNYVVGGKRAVYPMFNPEKHCRPAEWIKDRISRDAHKLEYYTLFDPGTSTVFAALFCAINRDTSEIFVLDEIYETNAAYTTPRLMWNKSMGMERVLYHPSVVPIRVYDEAAAWFGNAIAVEFGEGLVPSGKASRDKADDIGVIKDAMLNDKLWAADHCINFIREHSSWQTDDNGRPREKGPDHTLDLLRYLVRASCYSLNPSSLQYHAPDMPSWMRPSRKMGMEEITPVATNEVETDFDDLWWN